MDKRFVPSVVLAGFLAYAALAASGPMTGRTAGFDLAAFGRLPVSLNGRVQPFDSVARLSLLQIRGSLTVPLEDGRTEGSQAGTLDVNQWLLEVLAKPDAADSRRIFQIDEPELAKKLSLKKSAAGTARYAFRDIAAEVGTITAETRRVSKRKPGDRALWERELLDLQARLVLYERLKNSVQPNSALQRDAKGQPVAFDFRDALGRYLTDLTEAVSVADRHRHDPEALLDPATEQRLRAFSQLFLPVSRVAVLATVPPYPGEARERWHSTGAVIVNGARGVKVTPAVSYIAAAMSAFASGKADAFNDAVAKYSVWLASDGLAEEAGRAKQEAFYNAFRPFLRAMVVYLAGGILLLAAWRTRSTTAYRTAVGLIVLGFVLHTAGLVFVIGLAGRPSFAVSAGWTAGAAALVLERFRRYAGVAAVGAIGLLVLVPAQALAPGGPTAIVGAVLDLRLLPALVAAAIACAVAGVLARAPESDATGLRDRLSSGYFAVRRALRAE